MQKFITTALSRTPAYTAKHKSEVSMSMEMIYLYTVIQSQYSQGNCVDRNKDITKLQTSQCIKLQPWWTLWSQLHAELSAESTAMPAFDTDKLTKSPH